MTRLFRFLIHFVLLVGMWCVLAARAGEGMWPLPWREGATMDAMKAMGCSLSAEQIYSNHGSSLKDAIVLFGGGCTGEVVSAQGLVLTNHHCGYDVIQALSTVKNDFLSDGFWAASFQDELPAPGLTVTFLIHTEDVTDRLKFLDDSLRVAESKESAQRTMIQQYSRGDRFEVNIVPMYERNRQYLFVYETYTDVRLVGTPPASIGKFGGETDNWIWPRHTGDFSFFRIYADAQGRPAVYHRDNVPLHTTTYLPVSMKGLRPGDFTLVMGYPGTTYRYLPSFVAENFRDITHPTRITARRTLLEVLDRNMRRKASLKLKYASVYASLANYYKNSMAQMEALGRQDIVSEKRRYEQDIFRWLAEDSLRDEKYGCLFTDYEALVTQRRPLIRALQYYREAFMTRPGYVSLAESAAPLLEELRKEEAASVQDKPGIRMRCDSLAQEWLQESAVLLSEMDRRTDREVTSAMLELFVDQVSPEFLPPLLEPFASLPARELRSYSRELFARSIFVSERRRELFAAHPTLQALEKDPLFVLAQSIGEMYHQLNDKSMKDRVALDEYARLFMALLMEKQSERTFYPDANSTMRLTFGQVEGYTTPGGQVMLPFTSLRGVIEKEKPRDPEFRVPERLKTLFRQQDFGRYQENGDVPVCFLSSTDITGGNSGSPVLNARGELAGIAFDGNWEGALGDLKYDESLNRTINVDIRYVLFVVDKFAGAERLLREMEIRE